METLYLTDPRGVYVGSREIEPTDPHPLGAYLEPPPAIPGGQVALRAGDAWTIVDPATVPPLAVLAPLAPPIALEITSIVGSDAASTIVMQSGAVVADPSTGIDPTKAIEVTAPSATNLEVDIRLVAPGTSTVLPVTAMFRVAIRAVDGRERIGLATFSAGTASMIVKLADSGEWRVTQASINERLPPEQQMSFPGAVIYVHD